MYVFFFCLVVCPFLHHCSLQIYQKQIMGRFIEATMTGYLESGVQSSILPVSDIFWTTVWTASNAALKSFPPVGNAAGISPATPNGRIMEALGSTKNMAPLLATAAGINAVKGKLMARVYPFSYDTIRTLATKAVTADSDDAVNELLTAIRNVRFSFSTLNQFSFPSSI